MIHSVRFTAVLDTNVIVTNNIKDFPPSYLQSFGVDIKTARMLRRMTGLYSISAVTGW
ncbi:hypothetical protein NIASO_09160 [Niabella soli DSM 19437]|uniref:PIN domain-containing protein n=1 Tax=Niabella soli DSM 19437 TaxID=929713 RepID=W0F3B4_9BACT|nr:hypothetical protein NIASO_09160 [Niabella soli DSM 19437]